MLRFRLSLESSCYAIDTGYSAAPDERARDL